MRDGRGIHFELNLLDLIFSLKDQMIEIAYDFSNPIGDELAVEESLINDIHLLRPRDY